MIPTNLNEAKKNLLLLQDDDPDLIKSGIGEHNWKQVYIDETGTIFQHKKIDTYFSIFHFSDCSTKYYTSKLKQLTLF